MDQHALEHQLTQSEFSVVQARTLSHLLADQATREDLRVMSAEIRGEMGRFRAEMQGEIGSLRAEMRGEIGSLRAEMRGEIRSLRSEMVALSERLDRRLAETDARMSLMEGRLTWRLVAAAAFMGTVMTLVGALLN